MHFMFLCSKCAYAIKHKNELYYNYKITYLVIGVSTYNLMYVVYVV